MIATLKDKVAGTVIATLPNDLLWSDEFSTSQIAQHKKRTITGSLVVFEDVKTEGRLITLSSDDNAGWIARNELLKIRALGEMLDTDMELNYRGELYTVRFDKSNGSGIKAVPVIDCANPSNESMYALSLSLFTV